MGSQPPAQYVGKIVARRELGISDRQLSRFMEQGVLVPRFFKGKKQAYFLREDVAATKQAYLEKSDDIWHIKSIAMTALASARRTERRVLELYQKLGLDIQPIERSCWAIRRLYRDAERKGTDQEIQSPKWLHYWSGCFFSMDEVYLELVARYMHTKEPWKVLMDFASDVVRRFEAQAKRELPEAYTRFRASRDHLRYVSYMYCTNRYGEMVTGTIFNSKAKAVDEIAALLHKTTLDK